MPPLEAVLDAVEAYFTTLSPGRYTLERRERFCLEFRRGAWRGKFFDRAVLVPKFLGIDRRDVTTWPTQMAVTARPAPEAFAMSVQRDVQMPNGLPLRGRHHDEGTAAFDAEMAGLVDYLAEFLKLADRPDVTYVEAGSS